MSNSEKFENAVGDNTYHLSEEGRVQIHAFLDAKDFAKFFPNGAEYNEVPLFTGPCYRIDFRMFPDGTWWRKWTSYVDGGPAGRITASSDDYAARAS